MAMPLKVNFVVRILKEENNSSLLKVWRSRDVEGTRAGVTPSHVTPVTSDHCCVTADVKVPAKVCRQLVRDRAKAAPNVTQLEGGAVETSAVVQQQPSTMQLCNCCSLSTADSV